ncbi:MAG: Uncharacterised protein [Oceanospirillaceae bacterium UBA2001]|nr:MAG: Uncharacterised protein [Oceanospirillaceae bacterium UBA2001]
MLQLLKKVRVRSQPLNIQSQGAADDFTPGAKTPRPKRSGDRPQQREGGQNRRPRRS